METFARDLPDERDYNYDEIFGAEQKLPWKHIIDDEDYQDQSLEEITKYMCVFYSSSHGSNIQNYIELSDDYIEGKELGLIALDKWLLDPKAWAYIQSWPKLLRDLGYIDGWAKVNTIVEIKHSIYNDRPRVVWSNKIDWGTASVYPFIAKEGNSYGHAFTIIGYDDNKELLICKNSYGTEKFDNGLFYIDYFDYQSILFPSKYSLIDSEDDILKYKREIMEGINIDKAKDAYDLGLWNGLNPTQNASREEVATMVLRWLEKLRDGQI